MQLLHAGCHNPFAGFQATRHDDRVRRMARNDDFPPMHALTLGSTTQTAGLFSTIVSADEGISINDSPFNFSRPRTVAPRTFPLADWRVRL